MDLLQGGVGVSFSVGRTSYCFIAAHLAAHQGEKGQLQATSSHGGLHANRSQTSPHELALALQERNRDTVRILRELDLSGAGRDSCVSFDHLFLCGDLNYRCECLRALARSTEQTVARRAPSQAGRC